MGTRWGMLGIAVVGAPLLLAGLSACSAAPALELGSGGSACADSDAMRSATAGIPITNTGGDPVEIDQAGPAATSILDIEGSWIVPAAATASGGEYPFFIDEVPPTADFIRWADRADPAGAVVEPGETVYLVVSASLPEGEDSGWIEDFAVTAGGTDYVARAGMGLAPGGASCPWSPPIAPDSTPTPTTPAPTDEEGE